MNNQYGSNLKPPCQRDCPNRSATCHRKGECEAWDEYQEKVKDMRKRIADEKRHYKLSSYDYHTYLDLSGTPHDKE